MTISTGEEQASGFDVQREERMNKAQSYAASLIELARAEETLDKVDKDLRLATSTFLGHLDLKNSLVDKSLPASKKEIIIEEVFSDQLCRLTRNFLKLLAGMDQIGLLPDIADEFTKNLEAVENKAIAEVTTAIPLEPEFSARLTKRLSEMTGREVTIRAVVDPTIVGGVVVKVGGKLLDGSIRNQLGRLRDKMLEN